MVMQQVQYKNKQDVGGQYEKSDCSDSSAEL